MGIPLFWRQKLPLNSLSFSSVFFQQTSHSYTTIVRGINNYSLTDSHTINESTDRTE
jgi:hypothetical protein